MTTRHAHQPRLRRYGRPLVRLTQPPPDRAFDDVLAVALGIALLFVAALLASVVPLTPADPAALRAATRPAPSPVVWRMVGVSR